MWLRIKHWCRIRRLTRLPQFYFLQENLVTCTNSLLTDLGCAMLVVDGFHCTRAAGILCFRCWTEIRTGTRQTLNSQPSYRLSPVRFHFLSGVSKFTLCKLAKLSGSPRNGLSLIFAYLIISPVFLYVSHFIYYELEPRVHCHSEKSTPRAHQPFSK